jgi:hypothetical protein
MKIAIYGDSFACINTLWDRPGIEINTDIGPSWIEILERAGHSISNFAVSGTAFMFSYETFLTEYRNHDLNIFVVTTPQRIYVKALDGLPMFGYSWAESQYDRIKKSSFYPKKQVHLEILASVQGYLKHWIDWAMLEHVQHVLVNNLWSLASNTLIIPAFSDSIAQTSANLFDAAKHELKLVDENTHNQFDYNFLDCRRACHFSQENNQVLASKILNAITEGASNSFVTMDLKDVVKPKKSSNFAFYALSRKPR